MGDISILPGEGRRDPDAILECARKANLDDVLVLGWKDDDFWMSGSTADYGQVLLLLFVANNYLGEQVCGS